MVFITHFTWSTCIPQKIFIIETPFLIFQNLVDGALPYNTVVLVRFMKQIKTRMRKMYQIKNKVRNLVSYSNTIRWYQHVENYS